MIKYKGIDINYFKYLGLDISISKYLGEDITFGDSVDTDTPLVLISTDFRSDVDDVGAIRTALWAERMGYIDIIGLTVCDATEDNVQALDALLQYEGREDMAIGVDQDTRNTSPSLYAPNMKSYFPYTVESTDVAEDSDRLIRRAIVQAIASGRDLKIATLGYLTDMAKVLDSPADDISPLTGQELFVAGVTEMYVLGGAYPSGVEWNFTASASGTSDTIQKTGTNNFLDRLPVSTKVYFSGDNIGGTFLTGGSLRYAFPPVIGDTLAEGEFIDPVRQAYLDFDHVNGRESWDLMCIWLMVMADQRVTWVRGTNTFDLATGVNTFTANETGNHYYAATKLEADSYYQTILNNILDKVDWPVAPDTLGNYDLVRIPKVIEDSKIYFESDGVSNCIDLGFIPAASTSVTIDIAYTDAVGYQSSGCRSAWPDDSFAIASALGIAELFIDTYQDGATYIGTGRHKLTITGGGTLLIDGVLDTDAGASFAGNPTVNFMALAMNQIAGPADYSAAKIYGIEWTHGGVDYSIAINEGEGSTVYDNFGTAYTIAGTVSDSQWGVD